MLQDTVDYLSVGGFRADGVDTHHALLEAGICLPLRIVGGDGAPARAVLRRIGSTDQNETT
jgi:arylformamidase